MLKLSINRESPMYCMITGSLLAANAFFLIPAKACKLPNAAKCLEDECKFFKVQAFEVDVKTAQMLCKVEIRQWSLSSDHQKGKR